MGGRGDDDIPEGKTPPSDFGYISFARPDEEINAARRSAEVVSGLALLRGRLPSVGYVRELGLAVEVAIRKACGVELILKFEVHGDIKTMESEEGMGVLVPFDLLPRAGLSGVCLDNLSKAKRGASKPPFDERSQSTFRSLVLREMARMVSLRQVDTKEWFVQLHKFRCEKRGVICPARALGSLNLVSSKVADQPTADRTCTLFAAVEFDYASNSEAPVWKDDYGKMPATSVCERFTDACICAATSGCTWDEHPSGGFRCLSGGPVNKQVAAPPGTSNSSAGELVEGSVRSGVNCTYCPTQAHCKAPPPKCEDLLSPCACANYRGPLSGWKKRLTCWWNRGSCLPRTSLGENTTCSSCPTQSMCEPPEIARLYPRPCFSPCDDPLGVGEAKGRHINITFTKPIELRRSHESVTLEFPALLRCRPTREEQEAAESTEFAARDVEYKVPWGSAVADGSVLSIDVLSVKNDHPRDCHLILPKGAVADAKDGLPFPRFGRPVYSFALADTAPPQLVDVSPDNGAKDVPLGTKLSLGFNELVRAGSARSRAEPAAFRLVALGDATAAASNRLQGRSGEEDVLVDKLIATLDFSSPRVALGRRSLELDLGGYLKPGTLYTLGLAPGALTDLQGNEFGGLAFGDYAFRSLDASAPEVDPFGGGLTTTGVVLVVALVFSVGLAIAALVWAVRSARRMQERLEATEQRLDAEASAAEAEAARSTAGSSGWFQSPRWGSGKRQALGASARSFWGFATTSWSDWKQRSSPSAWRAARTWRRPAPASAAPAVRAQPARALPPPQTRSARRSAAASAAAGGAAGAPRPARKAMPVHSQTARLVREQQQQQQQLRQQPGSFNAWVEASKIQKERRRMRPAHLDPWEASRVEDTLRPIQEVTRYPSEDNDDGAFAGPPGFVEEAPAQAVLPGARRPAPGTAQPGRNAWQAPPRRQAVGRSVGAGAGVPLRHAANGSRLSAVLQEPASPHWHISVEDVE